MDKFRIGVKAFIVENGRMLFIRRRADDPHNPGLWDLPGGRVEPQEDPRLGLIRETKEETNLGIEVTIPLHLDHFQRQDGQVITLVHFLCRKLTGEIILSQEHQEFKWVDIENPDEETPTWLAPVLKNYRMYKKGLGNE